MAEHARADIYIGRKGKPNADTLAAAAGIVGGYTITKGRGGWIDDNGILVTERCYVVTLIGNGRLVYDAVDILAAYAHGCGEESVMVVWSSPTSVDFR